jgi:hypothetical protein
MKKDFKAFNPRITKYKLPLGVHVNKGTPDRFEVGCTNLYGSFRIEDFWTAKDATREECEEYIKRLQAASDEIASDILSRTPEAFRRV